MTMVFLLASTVFLPLSAASVVKNIIGIFPEPNVKFSGDFETTFMSGYLASSGAVLDTRPNLTHCLSLRLDLADDFFIDGYGWLISSMHSMQKEDHRALFNEFEGAVRLGYDYHFSEDMMLQTKAGILWNPPIGYDGSDMDYWGPYVAQYFRNEYVIPYWDGLWLVSPSRRARVRMGIRKPFAITDKFTLTPFVETVWLDERRFVARYREEPMDPGLFGGVFGSVTSGISFRYRMRENLTLYGSVSQFDIVNSQARRSVKRSKNYYSKCDWPIIKIGVSYSF